MKALKTRRGLFLALLALGAGALVSVLTLQGCGKQGSFSIPTNPIGTGVGTPGIVSEYSITLTSDKLSAKSGDKIKFTATVYYAASGARGPGRLTVKFNFAFASGGAGSFVGYATTDASGVATFEVTAPTLAICDILTAMAEVTSENGNLNTSNLTSVSIVGKDLALSPTSATIECLGTTTAGPVTFAISGGCPPYSCTFSTGGACTVTGNTVTYTPPAACPSADLKVTLTVSDTQGNSKSADITVKKAGAPISTTLAIAPTAATVTEGGATQTFVVSGGTPGYTFLLAITGGTLTSPGSVAPTSSTTGPATLTYTPPACGTVPPAGGTVSLTAIDSVGNTAAATITVNDPDGAGGC